MHMLNDQLMNDQRARDAQVVVAALRIARNSAPRKPALPAWVHAPRTHRHLDLDIAADERVRQ
jgi:hypothetical protein